MASKNIKSLVMAFIVGVLISSVTTTAYAATVSSDYGYFTVDGISYKNQAHIIYYSGSGAYVGTSIDTSSSETVPAGYMGVMARRYNDDGALVQSSDWSYNDIDTSGLALDVPFKESGTFYSYGMTRAFNGNGYDTYYTFRSPSINT